MRKIFLLSFNACTPGPNTRATELVWPSARKLSSTAAGGSGWSRRPVMAPFSSSRCPAPVRRRRSWAARKKYTRTGLQCLTLVVQPFKQLGPSGSPDYLQISAQTIRKGGLGLRSWAKERRFVMENRTTVLYVDDNPKSSRLLTSVLEECGFRVITKNDPIEALALCQRTNFDLALLDYEMPLMPGSKLAQEIKYLVPDVPVVLISGRTTLPSSELAFVDAHFGF